MIGREKQQYKNIHLDQFLDTLEDHLYTQSMMFEEGLFLHLLVESKQFVAKQLLTS